MADEYQAKQMMELFRGSDLAHGEFTHTHFEGKKSKGKPFTFHTPASIQMWEKHLDGKPPSLGVIPINSESNSHWGAIDIDDYELDYVKLLTKTQDTPLVCCKSKSDGVWLFLFSKRAVPAERMRATLTSICGSIGYQHSEIFPKRDKIDPKGKEVSNWLNMPYFGPSRYCIRLDYTRNGAGPLYELTLQEFIDYAYSKRVDGKYFSTVRGFDYSTEPISNGPPCLQVLSANGFPDHTRNTSLLNVGIYLKRADPNEWEVALTEFNQRFFKGEQGPLDTKEVTTTIQSLRKVDYKYQCHVEPLCSFCNAKLCMTREFGISGTNSLPIVNEITKIAGDESMWFMDVEGGRVTLTTEEFHDFRKFSIKCMSSLNLVIAPMPAVQYLAWVQAQMEKVVEIKDDVMFSIHDIANNLTQFILARLCKDRDDIISNRVWYSADEHLVRFKLDAFINYMKFKKIVLNKGIYSMFFKERGSVPDAGKTKDRRSYRCLAVPVTLEQQELIEMRLNRGEVM